MIISRTDIDHSSEYAVQVMLASGLVMLASCLEHGCIKNGLVMPSAIFNGN